MRLVNLTIRNFRGFGNAGETIPLEGDLLLFYGPNGFGKTSLAEAIEWLFYGMTKRRQVGEGFSKSEYAHSFANIHGGTPTEVTATVEIGSNRTVFSRKLGLNETSETFVDGAAGSFSSFRPIEAFYPVVAQHGLQTFVHSKPKDRRDAICAAFGLDELTALKNSLESARASFQRTPPTKVNEARRELLANVPILAGLEATSDLARRWNLAPIQLRLNGDRLALLEAAKFFTGVECATPGEALDSLRQKRKEASRSVFDTGKVASNVASFPAIEMGMQEVARSLENVERAIAAVTAATASSYKSAFLELWKKGLELSPSGEQCPMCEQETLTAAKRAELNHRLLSNADRIEKTESLGKAIDRARTEIARYLSQLAELSVADLSGGDSEQLNRLFATELKVVQSFLNEFDAFKTARQAAKEAFDAVSVFLNACVAQLEIPEKMPEVVARSARFTVDVANLIAPTLAAYRRYDEQWRVFEPKLGALVSSNELVARIDAVGKTLLAEPAMRLLDGYEKALDETQELIRAVESEMQRRQSALLTTRGAEVKGMYDRLNRGSDVVFAGMEPGTDSMKLNATSFGRRMSAAANLSECQLNCLGLAMWLMRATTPASPFGFVLLDDPVQSMDDDHVEAFIADVVPHLLDDHGKQVIVLTHVKRIAERLRELHAARAVKLFHYDSYSRVGPSITEQVALQKSLTEIKGASRGNEENRSYAVDRIRVLTEHFIRELHLKVMGVPAPSPRYDRATAKDLLPLFQTIDGTKPAELAGLRDTVQFSDPAHHTEVGYAVPILANIQPHIDRLENLLRTHGLIKQ